MTVPKVPIAITQDLFKAFTCRRFLRYVTLLTLYALICVVPNEYFHVTYDAHITSVVVKKWNSMHCFNKNIYKITYYFHVSIYKVLVVA